MRRQNGSTRQRGMLYVGRGRVLMGPNTSSLSYLMRMLSRTDKPMPAFVEGWASNSFHGQINSVPTGVASIAADTEGERILTMTVSGAAGATSVTGAGFDTTNGTGSWSCTILHDDGTYGVYTASGITAGAITISPGLRATTTAKPLASLGGTANGQHYGLQGYKALARRIYAVTNQDGYRLRYRDKMTAASATSGWTLVAGLGAGVVAYANLSNAFPNGGAGSYWRQRGNRGTAFDTAVAGRGLSRTVSLGGNSGYLEAFVGIDSGTAPSMRVRVLIDAVEVYNQVLTAFTRVTVPFTAATTGVFEITNSQAVQAQFRIGDVTWWTYDRTATWTDPVIGINDKVVVLGDSWSARYSGGLGLELAAAQTAGGGTTGSVTTVATGGMTAEWGLSVFDAQVASVAPNVVVIGFFVNDYNSFTVDSGRWLRALYRLGLKCQAIGARPVFVMPLPTQSISQSAELGKWAELVGAGLSA